jgi:hypothetical protein
MKEEHVRPIAHGLVLSAIESARIFPYMSAAPALQAGILEGIVNGWTRTRLESLIGIDAKHLASAPGLWKRLEGDARSLLESGSRDDLRRLFSGLVDAMRARIRRYFLPREGR